MGKPAADYEETLELKPGSELHSAVVVYSLGYCSEASITGGDVGKRKALMVSHVEHFGSNLELHVFLNFKFFGQRHVDVADTVAADS